MKRTIYAYKIDLQPISKKNPLKLDSFENDFLNMIKSLYEKEPNDRKQDFVKDKKVLYPAAYEYNDELSIFNFQFISAKYDARRNVIDTNTLTSKGILKTAEDGDQEKNHVCIKFIEGNSAVCLFESNYYGIGFGKIVKYLESKIKEYHKEKEDGCYYNLKYENIVSRDFLESLSRLRKIKAVTLTVDQEDVSVSDFKALSGKADISDSVDIMLKPAAVGLGILKDTVKAFYQLYNDQNKNIKRVTVQGDGDSKEALSFDTEQMKHKIIIDVDQTHDTGEVSTRNIFDLMLIEILAL